MKIREMEQKTGIPSANIRYYEKEGLLKPERNRENNYREYSEADVERLEQIKVLRLLGITVEDIKKLYQDGATLEEVAKRRLEQLTEEEQHLQEVKKVCENILQRDMDLSMLDEEVLGEEPDVWADRLEQIWKEDMTKVVLTRKSLNRHIMAMLIWGYTLCAGMALALRGYFIRTDLNWMERAQRFSEENPDGKGYWVEGTVQGPMLLFLTVVFVAIFCGIAAVWTASVKVHAVLFHICSLGGTPVLMLAVSIFAPEHISNRFCSLLPLVYILIIGYILIYWIVAEKWKRFYERDRNTVFLALIMTPVLTALAYVITGELLIYLAAFLILTVYIGLGWTAANRDQSSYNRYYAVLCANRIMNPIALLNSYYGRGTRGFYVGYNEDWKNMDI